MSTEDTERNVMRNALEYAQPQRREPSRLLAHASLAYPLFLLGALYGQWYFSWAVLGHAPRPSLDDPKYIPGASWMHPVTTIALIGLFPAAGAAIILNTIYCVFGPVTRRRLLIRVTGFLVLWLGMMAVLRYDPQPVLYWWFD